MGNALTNVPVPEAQTVTSEIESNCVVIFSKTYCSYCRATKTLFQNLGVDTKVIELDNRDDGDTMQDYLASITGSRTVPRVFINGKFVGGNSEVQELNKSGKLSQLLQQCGNT